MTPERMAVFARIHGTLKRAGPGKVLPVDERVLLDVLPHFWREEADTPEEWFIRYCRAFGLHLTESVEDEATITWPGQSHS
jgi:hypothetical protein